MAEREKSFSFDLSTDSHFESTYLIQKLQQSIPDDFQCLAKLPLHILNLRTKNFFHPLCPLLALFNGYKCFNSLTSSPASSSAITAKSS